MCYQNFQRKNWKNKLPGPFILFVFLLIGALFLLFFSPQNLYSQTSSLKYIKNYNTGMHSLNWSVLQDKRGIIYVANNGCVWEFDGVSPRIINIPGWIVRSLGMDENGTVYVGGINQVGYLKSDTYGTRQYISLLDHLKDNEKKFSTVYRINTTTNGVYFRTKKFLFRWKPKTKKMDVWEPEKEFNASFTCNGRLYVHQRGVGLMQMIDDFLKIIPGDEKFANAKIYMIAPYTPGSPKVLIGTWSKGFYNYDGLKAVPFPTEVDDYVKEKQLYHGIRLRSSDSPGEFALATLWGGLVIIDTRGKLKQIFNKTSGLQDDVIHYVFEDSQGNLWLALDKGLSKIEYASPISFYNEKLSNLPGSVFSITRFGSNNSIFVGTSHGLNVLQSSSSIDGPTQFQAIPGIMGNCWDLLPVGNSLLAATSNGVFLVRENHQVIEKIVEIKAYVFHHSLTESNRVLVGTGKGVLSLRWDDNRWVEEFRFKNITETIRTIAEDKKGNLWLGTLASGVLKVDFAAPGEISHPVISRYHNSHGLPGGEVRVFSAAGHVIFAAGKKIYRFNEEDRNFIPDYTMGKEFSDSSKRIFTMAEDSNKNIWFHSEFRNFQAAPQPDGTFVINKKPLSRIPYAQVNAIYPETDGNIVWFGGKDGLIQYDTRRKKNYNQDFSVFIREVVVNDIAMMYNIEEGKYKINNEWQGRLPAIPYKDRNITFKFAAPSFEDEDSSEYRCLLQGYDREWSRWDSEAKKVYTNLDSGFYTFRVQAKNVYNHLSREGLFRFKVLPPWYKTWWAFSCYALALLLLVFLVVKWRSGKLERENKRLEQTVKERTKEINEKNRQLEKQTLQLKEQSGQLKEMDHIKSRFFANISHEFRTPLTLIMGPLGQMLSNTRDKEEKKMLQMMLRNSQRLLHLINQLLDLSKFDSGKMKLQASLQNIVPFLKGINASFELIALQNQLDLSFHAEVENINLYFDTEKMEAVMCNLLVNATKFTPAGGKITVKVRKNEAAKVNTREHQSKKNGEVEISVCDTGPGSPREQLVHIFDRFYQVEGQNSNAKGKPGARDQQYQDLQGTGIGLALTRELVLLHHGTIDVRSSVGKESGTEFIIRLPLGKEHLESGEIVAPVQVTTIDRKSPAVISIYTDEDKNNDAESTNTDSTKILEKPGISEKESILVVEDNADARQFIRGALEPFYTVKEASDGIEGIEQAKKIIPDLVVSDIMMPKADGYELCNVLKDDIKTSHIPIILLTAKASEASIIQGLECGADDFITKPFSTQILLARIKNLIDLRRQWQKKIQREMNLQPADVQISSMDQQFFKEIQEVIEKNLSDDLFNVDKLGKKLYMSRTTLYRKILALTGEPPREFIRSYRLKRGAQLLKANFGNVTEVAFEVGFSSTTYFSKCFKEKFHQLPSAFLNSGEE
jgi:signal transduction histidine kinase/DNA-binding response OmpR family regulator